MKDERTARQRASSLRLAGRTVKHLCLALRRSEAWFHKGWRRYREAGPEGLYDLTRAPHHLAQRLPPELARTLLSVRHRLQAPAAPAPRYRRGGATAILDERKVLGIRPLASERPIERLRERNGLTAPRVRLDEVRWFLGECGKDLGRPEQVQFDNARELSGWGPAARTLCRMIRLCLRFGVSPVFIPNGEPQFHGSGANFNGWFQEPLFPQRFPRPGDLRRELARLQEAVNTQHVHPRLGGKTAAQHRRGLRLPKLPARFEVPTGRLPLAAGRVTFLRRVIDTGRGWRTAYLNGRVLKRWPYKRLNT